jgi:hypothetical protein
MLVFLVPRACRNGWWTRRSVCRAVRGERGRDRARAGLQRATIASPTNRASAATLAGTGDGGPSLADWRATACARSTSCARLRRRLPGDAGRDRDAERRGVPRRGGDALRYIPCLNDAPAHADVLAALAERGAAA